MCETRDSTSDERVATATVRLRFSMGRMIGTGAPLCQPLLRRCRPTSLVSLPVEGGGERVALGRFGAEDLQSPCDLCGRLLRLGARRARGASLLAVGVRLGE